MSQERASFVYIIGEMETIYVKIGHTTNLKARLSGVQVGNPRKLRILSAWHGTESDEVGFHSMFRRYRREGEWFDLPECILRDLKRKSIFVPLPPKSKPNISAASRVKTSDWLLAQLQSLIADVKQQGAEVRFYKMAEGTQVALSDVWVCPKHQILHSGPTCPIC
jgi:hypothetical protein